jgi:hypothetical protein
MHFEMGIETFQLKNGWPELSHTFGKQVPSF